MTKTLYLRVTQDKYQLPIAVFDLKDELAEFEGVLAHNISSTIANYKRKNMRCMFEQVQVEFTDDEIKQYGIENKKIKRSAWNENELELLRTTTLTDNELSKVLGKTVASIQNRRQQERKKGIQYANGRT